MKSGRANYYPKAVITEAAAANFNISSLLSMAVLLAELTILTEL